MNDAFHNLKMKIKNALQVYINKAVKKKKFARKTGWNTGHLQTVLNAGRKLELPDLRIVLRQIRSDVSFLWQLF